MDGYGDATRESIILVFISKPAITRFTSKAYMLFLSLVDSCFLSGFYVQAIEAAIELGLSTVEAGAQGEHKIQRGYLPVTTYSCHYLVDEAFRKAIGEFVLREASQVCGRCL